MDKYVLKLNKIENFKIKQNATMCGITKWQIFTTAFSLVK